AGGELLDLVRAEPYGPAGAADAHALGTHQAEDLDLGGRVPMPGWRDRGPGVIDDHPIVVDAHHEGGSAPRRRAGSCALDPSASGLWGGTRAASARAVVASSA